MKKFISKINKELDNFNAYDFVQYFGYMYYYYYDKVHNPKMPKDTICMKRAKDVFITHGLTNLEFAQFIDWALTDKATKKGNKMTVGLLPKLAPEYMKMKGFENIFDKENKEKEEKMDEEIKDWIKKEKERLKNKDS